MDKTATLVKNVLLGQSQKNLIAENVYPVQVYMILLIKPLVSVKHVQRVNFLMGKDILALFAILKK